MVRRLGHTPRMRTSTFTLDKMKKIRERMKTWKERRQLEARKEATKIKIIGLEVQIKRLKESGEVPKRIWRLENELAKLTRERNAFADELRRARAREQAKMQALKRIEQENLKARMQALKRIEQENLKALERKKPRMGALGWKRPGTRALEWKKPRMRAREWKKPRKGRER